MNKFIALCLILVLFSANNIPFDIEKSSSSEFNELDMTQAKLNIDTLKVLVEQKGDTLTWDDFSPYYCEDKGFGMYVLQYPITEDYFLQIVGVGFDHPPMNFFLVSERDTENFINILTEDIDDFIKQFD